MTAYSFNVVSESTVDLQQVNYGVLTHTNELEATDNYTTAQAKYKCIAENKEYKEYIPTYSNDLSNLIISE
jgi:hypothetical protein